MELKEKVERLSEAKFQELFGVKKITFSLMLEYYRHYVTMEKLAFDHNVEKSTICDTIRWVETTLQENDSLPLPKRRNTAGIEEVAVDVTEIEIERPKEKQEEWYSGKKRHTQKVQIVAHAQSKDILSVDFAKESVHDKKIFDESGIKIDDETLLKGDSGYQGIQKRVQRCDLPIKKVKGKERSQDEKEFNKEAAKESVFIEHINRYIKRFRIFSTRYRNGLEGFSCKFTLICGIYNLQH